MSAVSQKRVPPAQRASIVFLVDSIVASGATSGGARGLFFYGRVLAGDSPANVRIDESQWAIKPTLSLSFSLPPNRGAIVVAIVANRLGIRISVSATSNEHSFDLYIFTGTPFIADQSDQLSSASLIPSIFEYSNSASWESR